MTGETRVLLSGALRGLRPGPALGSVAWRLPLQAIAARRGRLFLFVPVFLAIGIGLYFALPREPVFAEWLALGASVLAFVALAWRVPDELSPLLLALALTGTGLLLAGQRAHQVAAPVLNFRYFGPIEGRIVGIDRAATDRVRLTLDQVVLQNIPAHRTPERVRISLHGPQGFIVPQPGLRVMTTGHLSPPPAPSEPGGFDFRRLAWFERLGAVGHTRVPVLTLAPVADSDPRMAVHRLRMRISAAVMAQMPGDTGGFAAAILTGDRSGIAQDRMEDLRRSNLAHLLAISGLHMGLLTGFVFGGLRLAMALVPPLALRLPVRKLAAIGALGAGAFYLMLSGGNVATERAFIMVAVMLVAVLLDRRAISLRSVAMAATLILILRPEALTQAGFQMSFAATVALVAVFRWLSREREFRSRVPRWVWPVASVVLCSVVAGIATAPVAAASFNRVAEYGLMANLLAVPLMGLVIMPSAVLAAVLTPIGLQGLGLAIMDPAIGWILHVSGWVSGLDGAVTPVRQPAPWVIPAMALGALWVIIWQGRSGVAGLAVIALAAYGWTQTPRPVLLVAPDATLIGLMGPEGRMLSRARSNSFAASAWLQADGDAADQARAHARSGAPDAGPIAHLRGSGFDVVHLSGLGGLAMLEEVCLPGRLVVTTEIPEPAPRPCDVIDPSLLRQTGAVSFDPAGMRNSVAEQSGQRPWSR